MHLRYVTITGADETIRPSSLVELTHNFPFVEWGIVLSSRVGDLGKPTMPGRLWLDELAGLEGLPLSCHLCGRFVAELIKGRFGFAERFPALFARFQRIQINYRSTKERITDPGPLFAALSQFRDRVYILQQDAFDPALVDAAVKRGLSCCVLSDRSAGRGKLPAEWPTRGGVPGGYAGGLGPDNLSCELGRLGNVVDSESDRETWIDMQSGVRTDKRFDLEKVRNCLTICRPFAIPRPPIRA
jgi:hypothetical protein